MRHPDKSLLLAYTRQQFLGEAESSIRQHMEMCKECSQRYDEYKQINIELKDTLAYWQRTAIYPPVANRVFEAIENPAAAQLARRERRAERRQRNTASGAKLQSLNWTRLLSTGVALLLILTVFVGFFLHEPPFQPNSNKQGHSNSFVIPGHVNTATSTHSSTPQGTGTAAATEGATVTPGTQQFTLTICTISPNSFTLCASPLKPGDEFQVTVNVRGKGNLSQHQAVVDRDGRLTVTWNVNICGVNRVNVHLHSRKTSLDISQFVAVPNKGCFNVMH